MQRLIMILALGIWQLAPDIALAQTPAQPEGGLKLAKFKVGEIVIVGGDAKLHAGVRKTILLLPGQILDDKALRREEENLKEIATVKVLDSKNPGIKDILVTLNQAAGKKDAPGKADSLEQLIAEALKNNPDIRVAESRLRAAEAEAERARMKLVAELTALHADIEAAEAGVREGEARYDRAKVLHVNKAISDDDLAAAQLTVVKVKAELAGLHAKLPYLLGKHKAGVRAMRTDAVTWDLYKTAVLRWEIDKATNLPAISDEEFARRVTLDLLGRMPTAAETKSLQDMPAKDRREKWVEQLLSSQRTELEKRVNAQIEKAPWAVWAEGHELAKSVKLAAKVSESPLTAKLRKALDANERMDFEDVALMEAFEYVRDKMLPGINLNVRAKIKKETVRVKLGQPVPVGAVLQFLEDELDIVFVLREYGVVVVGASERLPPDTIRVLDFWKQGAAQAAKDAK